MNRRRERLHKQPRKKFEWLYRINIFKYLSILLIIVFILSTPTVVKKLIQIKSVTCHSQYGECPENLTAIFRAYESRDYKVVKDGLEKILKSNNQVSSFLIQYKIPSTLEIELTLRKPKFAIKDSLNRHYLIDTEGNVLEVVNQTDLPTLTKNDANYTVGQKTSEADQNALEIFEKTNFILSVSSAVVEKDILKITIDNRIVVLFPLNSDVDVLVGSLRLIFSRLNESAQGIKMEDVREIDLRFANPVLR